MTDKDKASDASSLPCTTHICLLLYLCGHTATRCNTMQHTATHTATHCNTLQHSHSTHMCLLLYIGLCWGLFAYDGMLTRSTAIYRSLLSGFCSRTYVVLRALSILRIFLHTKALLRAPPIRWNADTVNGYIQDAYKDKACYPSSPLVTLCPYAHVSHHTTHTAFCVSFHTAFCVSLCM